MTKEKTCPNNRTNSLVYIGLIVFIWFVTYVVCQFGFDQKLGWDEVSYLATAKGIAANFDFSSRFNSVEGLLKHPFPQHTHHYPVYSTYLAVFFKLFGTSLKVAYFSTWLCGLIACIFIYKTIFVLTDKRFLSSLVGISFLFLPRITEYCDSAMMEIPSVALISVLVYFIFKDLKEKKVNPMFLAFATILLFLFKSLFIGITFGFLLLIYLAYTFKLATWKIKKSIPFSLSLVTYIFLSGLLYFIFTKCIFLPLAPMMSFHKKQIDEGIYSDFAGGFFRDPVNIAISNLHSFYTTVIKHYFPMLRLNFYPSGEAFSAISPTWIEFGMFSLFFFYTGFVLIFRWRKIDLIKKIFILFSLISIVSFNAIFIIMATSGLNLYCRYNLLYLTLLLISFVVLIEDYLVKYKKQFLTALLPLIVFVYIPFYYADIRAEEWRKDFYSNTAHVYSKVIRKFVGESSPMFVYFNNGTHTSWDYFPTRIIVMEANNEKIKRLNKLLPKPIEYLFIQPQNLLFTENRRKILTSQPIIGGLYTFYGADQDTQVIAYKYNRNN
ncbi:MAG: glycosyltransferase family 39 protein [Candidatus Melainabacteria bacterium]|nr:glycosyltransferase family 39 protein [Candidatus Melainabacteria bacterium]